MLVFTRLIFLLDTIWATKLCFAYLQYPAIEFYALSESSKNNRPLLLAFAWLLGTQDILSVITHINLSNSVLGRECSRLNSVQQVINWIKWKYQVKGIYNLIML